MRSENEMQITLARLRDEFSVNVTPAQELHGQELADWLNWPRTSFSTARLRGCGLLALLLARPRRIARLFRKPP